MQKNSHNTFKTFHFKNGIETEIEYEYKDGIFIQPKLYFCEVCQISDLNEEYILNHDKYNYHFHKLIDTLKKDLKQSKDDNLKLSEVASQKEQLEQKYTKLNEACENFKQFLIEHQITIK